MNVALLLLLLLFLGVVVQSTIETPSQHRSTIQACPKKGKQARADRAGIEPGTFRRKPVPPDHKTKPPRCPESPKRQKKKRVCASLRSRNALQQESAVNTTQSARGQKSPRARICGKYHAKRSRPEVANSLCASLRSRNALRHQARARICGKYRSRPERAPQSGTKAFSLTLSVDTLFGERCRTPPVKTHFEKPATTA